jgi:catechol-2,3-dioxygenase
MNIARLELQTGNLQEQALFYGQTLGLETHRHGQNQLKIHAGATELVFNRADADQIGPYHFAFNIPGNLFEAGKSWLTARVEILANQDGETSLHSESWNSDSVYFKDAAGNILELIARHELPNAGGRLRILSISEIGLATGDVPDLVKTFEAQAGLLPYKGETSGTFTAVGDANGLFITVKQGRIWYPNTGVPARLLPVRVDFQVDGVKMILSGPPYQLGPKL